MINHYDVSSSFTSQFLPWANSLALWAYSPEGDQTGILSRDLEVYWKKLNRGGLKNLKSLNLSHNKFIGRIPLSFGGLQSLESLDLSHNNLFGEIPCTLANFFELSDLDLSNNKLKGHIPSGPQMDRINDPNSYANNSGLCGMQIKVSCEKVPSKPNLKEENPKNSKSWEIWFSWEMAVIGYPSGFLSTILAMYVIGYFNVAPQPSKRRRNLVRHGLFGI
ncbi:hypothetical protein GH714_034961 [Hevea brasiliensis]|uniref:Uncharacterized protein n=1 Tax=Hevea brasiliensis TaxID=3981 RepID=A0A6A6L719_HEVBR|nr:hypothetical protein GH714_034961 [Hevea brasiliensis]